MFPEYRDLITTLKTTNLHFKTQFERHNDLDQQIKNLEGNQGHVHARAEEIEALKKEKLALKDELYKLLQKHAA